MQRERTVEQSISVVLDIGTGRRNTCFVVEPSVCPRGKATASGFYQSAHFAKHTQRQHKWLCSSVRVE